MQKLANEYIKGNSNLKTRWLMLAKMILIKVYTKHLICVCKLLINIGITKDLFYKLFDCNYWQTILA